MMPSKILIVDDEQLIRESLRLDLVDQGYAVDAVASGEDAVAKLSHEYDLIITDLIMEGMDGLAVLRAARTKRHDQLVFILTGYGELESAIGALRLGAEDYLLKPYNHEELMLRIQRCLETRRLKKTVRLYESMLSICSECKKIRDDRSEKEEGEWISIEQFLSKSTGSELTHGICPECYRKKMAELDEMIRTGRLFPSS